MFKNYPRILSFCIAMSVVLGFALNSKAFADCSPLDSSGYILLHPYFDGKNWKKTVEDNIIIYVPDTLCSQQVRPVRFDVGKSLDSTLAAFSTVSNDFFIMESRYFHYAGACRDSLGFSQPQKIPLSGMTFTGSTPWYLVKDSAYNLDTVKIVFGVNSQYCLAATIKTNTASIVKIDTLHLQNTNTISAIQGAYSSVLKRDTCIFVTGSSGMLRQFSYKPSGWGAEVKHDITPATETVLCATATYAGTNTGKIYKKNAAQSYILDNSFSTKAINTLYPQGAIGNGGTLIENVNGTWRSNPQGSANYHYANFIKRGGGFGVELLDDHWNYSVFTYRDTTSKILLTNPVDIQVNNVNKSQTPYVYNSAKASNPKDSTISIYISDPDSNYSDVSVVLNSNTLENDGTHAIKPLPDSESCHIGGLKLTDGILKITMKKDSVIFKTATMLGVNNVGCFVCNWKSYNFSNARFWSANNFIVITAGNDRLEVYNQGKAAVTAANTATTNSAIKNQLRMIGNNLIFEPALHSKKIESIVLYDFAGRKLLSFPNTNQTTFEIPRSLTSGISCLAVKYADGSVERQIVPLLR